jgi:hypothetical protein
MNKTNWILMITMPIWLPACLALAGCVAVAIAGCLMAGVCFGLDLVNWMFDLQYEYFFMGR